MRKGVFLNAAPKKELKNVNRKDRNNKTCWLKVEKL